MPYRRAYAASIGELYTRSPSALSERFEDVTLVLDHRTGRSVRLNAAAGVVWDALDGPATPATAADRLAARFGLSADRAMADAVAALDSLEGYGLVTRSGGRSGR